jgi:hypothetical protein
MPIHHVLDHNISDFAFGFEHFEDFMAKRLFKVLGFRRGTSLERTVAIKAAICTDYMQVGIKILKITLRAVGLRAGGQSFVRRLQQCKLINIKINCGRARV